jgi:LacI family transcriptional regulator
VEEPHEGRSRPTATLRAVAEAAGVHVSTVSRVLNGTIQTTPETAERIRATAERLGYFKNVYAASLRTHRTHILGVLVPRLTDYVLAALYEGIEDAAAERGFRTFVASTHDVPEVQRSGIEALLSWRVDGLIIGDARLDGDGLPDLVKREVPFVLVNRRFGDYPSVTCDDYTGGRLAAEHLLSLGHTRVAVLAGEPYASTCYDRTQGFLDTYLERGHPVPTRLVIHSDYDTAGGQQAMLRVLRSRRKVTAVFSINDAAAIGAIGVLRDYNLRPGHDIAVMGFNDIPEAAALTVPLSTVRSPLQAIGRRATETLLALLDGKSVQSERLKPELVIRASTGSPNSGEPDD